jgi:hypothetical protein
MQIFWIEKQCQSVAHLSDGYTISAEWINENKWIAFVQDPKGNVVNKQPNINTGLPFANRELAKNRAFSDYIKIKSQTT